MDNYLYIIIIIGLTIFIIFYGGFNQQKKVEYNIKYFDNLNTIIIFEKKINKILKKLLFNTKDFININEYFDTTNILIPNFIDCFFIQIKSYNYFNINNIVKNKEINTNMMIIFNHNKHNNLELLIDNLEYNLYNNNNLSNNYTNTFGYFYDLEKVISITSIYHIYNNSNENIIITCFILKKPFWHN